jgi:hypothetical protein
MPKFQNTGSGDIHIEILGSAGIKKNNKWNLAGQQFGKKDGEEGCHANVEAEKYTKNSILQYRMTTKDNFFHSPPDTLFCIFPWPEDNRGGTDNKILEKIMSNFSFDRPHKKDIQFRRSM